MDERRSLIASARLVARDKTLGRRVTTLIERLCDTLEHELDFDPDSEFDGMLAIDPDNLGWPREDPDLLTDGGPATEGIGEDDG